MQIDIKFSTMPGINDIYINGKVLDDYMIYAESDNECFVLYERNWRDGRCTNYHLYESCDDLKHLLMNIYIEKLK